MEDVLDPPVNKDPDQDKLIQDQSTPFQTNPKDLDTLVVSRRRELISVFCPVIGQILLLLNSHWLMIMITFSVPEKDIPELRSSTSWISFI